MSYSNYNKVLKVLKNKPTKIGKIAKHNTPKKRSCGKSIRRCKLCGRIGGHVSKYGIDFCRQCFREKARNIGFKKYC